MLNIHPDDETKSFVQFWRKKEQRNKINVFLDKIIGLNQAKIQKIGYKFGYLGDMSNCLRHNQGFCFHI